MTYYYGTNTYEFTAFSEDDLLQGTNGDDINCGDVFTMPGSSTICFSVKDNDTTLSGDSCWNEHSNDGSYQTASIIDAASGNELGNGGQIYAESYFWVQDQNGNWYVLIEIEQEGTGDKFYTFYTGSGYSLPPAGATLTVKSECNVSDWEPDFRCLDAGEKAPMGSISGRFFCDADCDNTEWNSDTGTWEEGVAGQKVWLIDGNWNIVAETVTDADGNYKFEGLDDGWYKVKFEGVDGKSFVEADQGVWHADSDVTKVGSNGDGKTDWICLGEDEQKTNIDAGVKQETGTIWGTVWCDLDCDGIQDVETTIYKGENLLNCPDFEGAGKTIYNVGHYGNWYDAGSCSIDIISGSGDGHKGNAYGNEIVELDKGGIWCQQFNVAESGTYCLTFDVYDNCYLGDYDDRFKVKINGQLIETVVVTKDDTVTLTFELQAGQNRIDFQSLSTVSGKGSGIDNIELRQEIVQTTLAEPVKEGVVVKLLDAVTGAVIAETTTDADGNYKFDSVPVGDYKIMGVAPDGTEFTIQDAGTDDSVDSDVDGEGVSGVVTVTAKGEIDIDLGVCEKAPEPGSLSGRYFCDTNDNDQDDGNGNEPGVAGVLVILIGADGLPAVDIDGNPVDSVFTDANGEYSFGNLAAGTYRVVFDDVNGVTAGKQLVTPNVGDDASDSDAIGTNVLSSIDGIVVVEGQDTPDNDAGVEYILGSLSGRYFCDTNDNDQDDNNGDEPGIEGVLVELLDANGVATGITTTTDADGNYSFGDLVPGTYGVKFSDPNGVLADKQLVNPNVGDDASDSDAIGDTTMSTIDGIVVNPGADTPDNDAGVEYIPGSLSGRYFCDTNDNDQDDNNGDEPGIEGVVVELLDANGVATGITTTTDADGNYSFGDLVPGTYGVKFSDPNGVLADKQLVAPNVGDDTSDSDAIGDTTMSTIDGIVVNPGADTPDNDAGVEYILGSLSGRYFCDTNDNDQDDNNGDEPGIEGVVVELLDAAGNGTGITTTTDSNGNYQFTGLAAGIYGVMFTDPNGVLDGKVLVNPNVGDDASDSDAIGDITNSKILGIEVLPNADTPDNDAGVEYVNNDPEPNPDEAKICYDEAVSVDVLANDIDPDGDPLTITAVNGVAIAEGGTINVDGVDVSLIGGQLVFDGSVAHADLLTGETDTDSFAYTITDGNGGSASAQVDVTFCGATDTLEKIESTLPAQLCFTISEITDTNTANAFDVTLSGSGDARFDGQFFAEAYCVQAFESITYEQEIKANVFLATEASFAAAGLSQTAQDNVDLINWILNQDFGSMDNGDGVAGPDGDGTYTDAEIQGAIWGLTDNIVFVFDGAGTAANAQEIIDMAVADGEGFEAGAGDLVGLFLDPIDGQNVFPGGDPDEEHTQAFVIGMDLFEDCLCR